MFDIRMPRSDFRYAANTYIFSSNGEACVIDPAAPFNKALCPERVKFILFTHSHYDHILYAESWHNATGAPVFVSSEELSCPADPDFNCVGLFFSERLGFFGEVFPILPGDKFNIGDEVLCAIECPGHTKGSLSFLGDGICFVGDTVFAGGGYGRWDFPSGDISLLRDSIRKLISLPDKTMLYPGHGESTTVEEYKRYYKMR